MFPLIELDLDHVEEYVNQLQSILGRRGGISDSDNAKIKYAIKNINNNKN
jgi:hypothetical protein